MPDNLVELISEQRHRAACSTIRRASAAPAQRCPHAFLCSAAFIEQPLAQSLGIGADVLGLAQDLSCLARGLKMRSASGNSTSPFL